MSGPTPTPEPAKTIELDKVVSTENAHFKESRFIFIYPGRPHCKKYTLLRLGAEIYLFNNWYKSCLGGMRFMNSIQENPCMSLQVIHRSSLKTWAKNLPRGIR